MVQLLLLVSPVSAAVAAGYYWPRVASTAAAVAAFAVAAILSLLWTSGAGTLIDAPWLASVGSRFRLELDALAAPLAIFVTIVAAAVFAFTAAYLPRHLEKEQRASSAAAPFNALMLGFMLAMLLLLLAQDLLVILLALEMTALASFFLIRFDDHKAAARRAALVALVVTAGSSLLFLVGALMVAARAGSTVLSHLASAGAAGEIPPAAVACLILGVLGKSAQVPLHFWLPRAMIAPTPVSAYLHSAALVAAGVFVLQRLRFLLEAAPALLDWLFWLAFLSIAVGGLLALTSDEFKRILAYSTIAQYGYAVALIAAGGDHGVFGASFFLLAHGPAKCALFMTAGAVTTATGEDRLSRSGGHARHMPLLACASAVAAAGLAGLPLTIGYFKDDLLIKTALERGPLTAVLAAAAIALTLAYTARFWFGIFGGARRAGPAVARGLSWPVAALAGLVVLGGLWLGPIEAAFSEAGRAIARAPVSVHLAYEIGTEIWLALAAWGAGAALALSSTGFDRALGARLARLSAWLGPAAWADRLAAGSAALSDLLHRLEVRDMRDRLTAIMVPTGLFVLLGVPAHGAWPEVGPLRAEDLPLAASLLVVAAAALVAVCRVGHLSFVLLLSFVGVSLALAFALAYAPDVALVLILVETAFTLLFLGMLSRIRPAILDKARHRRSSSRGLFSGVAAGVVATVTAWLALSAPQGKPMAIDQIEATGRAHARDVVTAIVTDFRGLDTAGELTVLVVALYGAAAILWGRQT